MIRTAATIAVGALLAFPLAASVTSANAVQGGPAQGVYRVPVVGVCADARVYTPISVRVGDLCSIPFPLNRGGGVDPSMLSNHFKTIPGVYSVTGHKVALRVY
jgi:hypothetical protein